MKYKVQYNIGADIKKMIMELRGITDEWEQQLMISHTEDTQEFVIPDAEKIRELLFGDKSVVIFGDYDVDGISAAQIASMYIPRAYVVIPERSDGYGLTMAAAHRIVDLADVILTVDCGITSKEPIRFLRSKGKEVIVTDHHIVQEAFLPDAIIVHPQLMNLPFHEYCGSVVIYKTLKQLTGKDFPAAIQLACLGTVCDVMPLIKENRGIVARGLNSMFEEPCLPIVALKNIIGKADQNISEGDLGFYIGPMINACGRMGRADVADSLMGAKTLRDAESFALMAKDFNNRRKEVTRGMVALAPQNIVYEGAINVYVYDDILGGMAGLIANGVVNETNKPVLVLIRDGDVYRGSMRSPMYFNCASIIDKTREHILSGGGHSGAAGLVLRADNLRTFLDSLKDIADSLPIPRLYEYTADIQIDKELVPAIISDIQELRPYGVGFEAPTLTSILEGEKISPIGTEKKHTRVTEGGVDYAMFNVTPTEFKSMTGGGRFHVAYRVDSEKNSWTGRPSMIIEKVEAV